MVTCRVCKEAKPQENYSLDRNTKSGYRSECKACAARRAAEWRAKNPDRTKASRKAWADANRKRLAEYTQKRYRSVVKPGRDKVFAKKYGLTLEAYRALYEGGCAICGRLADDNGRALSVDHDHSCCPGAESCGNCVRGVLCNNCNWALGLLEDDPTRLEKARDYLSRR